MKGDEKEYQSAIPIAVACKSLKHAIKFSATYVSKESKSHYMKATFASKTMQSKKFQDKNIDFTSILGKLLFHSHCFINNLMFFLNGLLRKAKIKE